ncbi:hypothetical protein C0991_012442 [Blastosporella zonata]|nr:hypothetical protein C0991_012442 [Blastosporella zonata]
MLSRDECHDSGYKTAPANFGARCGAYILMVISLLLLIREAYTTATGARANNERLWHPLLALPELLVVMMFVIPGLVPRRAGMFMHSEPIVLVGKKTPIVPALSAQPQAHVDIAEPTPAAAICEPPVI